MEELKIKIKLSMLWVVVLFNMIFADIFSAMVEFIQGGMIVVPFDVVSVMAVAAVITNIPIMMIFLTWIFRPKTGQIANVVASFITILYVIGGGVMLPHYFIMAGVEILMLILIIYYAKQWQRLS